MNTYADKIQENTMPAGRQESQSVAAANPQMQSGAEPAFQFVDNRPEAAAQRKLQEKASNGPRVLQMKTIQTIAEYGSSSGRLNFSVETSGKQKSLTNKAINPVQKASIVQRAEKGELSKDEIVEANDDGEVLRGKFVKEKVIGEDYLVGVFMVTHENNLPVEEEYEYEMQLSKIKKYEGGPPIRQIPEEGVDITHFSGTRTKQVPYGSEYVVPHDPWEGEKGIANNNKIEVTNHGLGSGIYGLTGLSQEQIDEYEGKYNSKAHKIHMSNPLFLQDSQHGTLFTALSKKLQRAATSIRTKFAGPMSHYGVDEWMKENQEEVNELTTSLNTVLIRVGRETVKSDQISNALFDFFVAYNTTKKGDVVAQPINFLMKSLGYDGVFGDNESDNSFGRGSVSYNLPKDMKKESHVSRINN